MADLLVTFHLAFVAFVAVGQLLILVGWAARWGWVRNFWFRLAHLLAIGYVAAEAFFGITCPLTLWEARLRGGDLHNVEQSTWFGRQANRLLYYQTDDPVWFYRAYIAFGVLVLATFFLCRVRWPWGKKQVRA
jgi:hypothetical protein